MSQVIAGNGYTPDSKSVLSATLVVVSKNEELLRECAKELFDVTSESTRNKDEHSLTLNMVFSRVWRRRSAEVLLVSLFVENLNRHSANLTYTLTWTVK